jgi:hypothetical protein
VTITKHYTCLTQNKYLYILWLRHGYFSHLKHANYLNSVFRYSMMRIISFVYISSSGVIFYIIHLRALTITYS